MRAYHRPNSSERWKEILPYEAVYSSLGTDTVAAVEELFKVSGATDLILHTQWGEFRFESWG